MPEPTLDFNFYVRGIEDGILEALTAPMQEIEVNDLALYSGQLDDVKALETAIKNQSLRYPFLMASYAGGASTKDPATSRVLGRPIHHRHDCTFSVIVADDNPQGETERRNKVYEMASIVWNTLIGVRLKKQVDEDTQVLLNTEPFDEPEHVMIGLPNATGLGIMFDIAFKWTSPDRTQDGLDISEIIVGVDSLNEAVSNPGNLPGVEIGAAT